MTTHHGRPGGRLVELLVGFALILLSAGLLSAGILLVLLSFYWVFAAQAWLGAAYTIALVYAAKWWGGKVAPPIMRGVWRMLALIWEPFLSFYGYEAHSLRPIKTNENNK